MILIRKRMLDKCPFCQGTDLKDVSNEEYPCMYQCSCGKITAVECDADTLKTDCVYLNEVGLCWSKGKPDCLNCNEYRVEEENNE